MIILDSSFIVSYFNERDENHFKAVELMKDILNLKFGRIHITDYIFDETVTVSFIRLKKLHKVIEIGHELMGLARILEVENTHFLSSWDLFKRQRNTAFSFTDCTTISVMAENEIKNIATFDEDFKTVKEINVVC